MCKSRSAFRMQYCNVIGVGVLQPYMKAAQEPRLLIADMMTNSLTFDYTGTTPQAPSIA